MKSHLHQTRWWVSLVALTLCTIIFSSCALSNNSPVIVGIEAGKRSVSPSGSCGVYCIASDADDDSLTYSWSATGGTFSGTGPTITWMAPDVPGTYTITVLVEDGKGGESRSSLSITVAPNHPPIIENLIVTSKEPRYLEQYLEGYRILKGKSCNIRCVASDPDNDILTFEWSTNGGNISGDSRVVTWTAPLRAGEVVINVRVSDNRGGVASKSIVFTVDCCPYTFK